MLAVVDIEELKFAPESPFGFFENGLAIDLSMGYAEKIPERAMDSFNTFEEILSLAVENNVDLLLLGGDLFHDNKPSRNAEMRCIELLRKYVLGSDPVTFQVVSDPAINFSHCVRKEVNFLDPNMNIGLPVFSIHGNHDDPSGLGGHSCMDLLHSTGLLNYFGRINTLDEVNVSPILIKKGRTKLALYGMSSIKDERLHRLFRSNRVTMLRPEEETDSWFNLLTLHQNRSKHGPTNYIPEHFIDEFFDLVFWGHEHECRLQPEVNGEKEFYVTQPGSSVATSLCEGEAKDKFVGLLEINHEKQFKITPIKLQTVRPLIFQTISLDECNIPMSGIDEKKAQEKIEKYLKTYVEELIHDADNKLTGHENQPKLPLIRLRVEYSEEAQQLAPSRFGNLFHDKVANPSDILLFRKKPLDRKLTNGESEINPSLMDEISDNLSMEDFVAEYFRQNDDDKGKLKLLGIKGIGAAVSNYIVKDDKSAVNVIVEKQLQKTMDKISERHLDDWNDEVIDQVIEDYQEERKAKVVNETKEAIDMLATGDRVRKKAAVASNFEDVDMEEDGLDNLQTTSAPATRGRGRGRGRGSRGSRGSRGAVNKTPVSSNSIQSAFARQATISQGSSRSKSSRSSTSRGPVSFIGSSDED